MENFETVPGKGVKALNKGEKIGLGNQRLLEDFKISLNDETNQPKPYSNCKKWA